MQNQSNCGITFDTQLKNALKSSKVSKNDLACYQTPELLRKVIGATPTSNVSLKSLNLTERNTYHFSVNRHEQ